MKQTYIEALQAFPRWMNCPTARVQVFTWRVFQNLTTYENMVHLRVVPAYRNAEILAARRELAVYLRAIRKFGKVELPTYSEEKANYLPLYTGRKFPNVTRGVELLERVKCAS